MDVCFEEKSSMGREPHRPLKTNFLPKLPTHASAFDDAVVVAALEHRVVLVASDDPDGAGVDQLVAVDLDRSRRSDGKLWPLLLDRKFQPLPLASEPFGHLELPLQAEQQQQETEELEQQRHRADERLHVESSAAVTPDEPGPHPMNSNLLGRK